MRDAWLHPIRGRGPYEARLMPSPETIRGLLEFAGRKRIEHPGKQLFAAHRQQSNTCRVHSVWLTLVGLRMLASHAVRPPPSEVIGRIVQDFIGLILA